MNQNGHSIHITPHLCAGCYRCLRVCPVKAISIREQQPDPVSGECVRCGHCIPACPRDNIGFRDDIDKVKRLIKTSDTVVASVERTWPAHFKGILSHRFIEALRLLGFHSVGETIPGHIKYREALAEQLDRHPRPVISTECPVVTRWIRYHYPLLAEQLLPVAHPAVLHSRMIRHWQEQSVKVVHITQCAGMKSNPDEISELDAVITFDELKEWMKQDGVEFDMIPGNTSYEFEPVSGGAIPPADGKFPVIRLAGIGSVQQTLDEYCDKIPGRDPLYLKLNACGDDCLSGPGSSGSGNWIEKRIALGQCTKHPDTAMVSLPYIPTFYEYTSQKREETFLPGYQLQEMLRRLGKSENQDRKDCGICGYDKCLDFAQAVCVGKAEMPMCIHHENETLTEKLGLLMERIPVGVLFLSDDLRLLAINPKMESLCERNWFCDADPVGQPVASRNFPFAGLVKAFTDTGKSLENTDVRLGDRSYKINLTGPRDRKIICLTLSDTLGQGPAWKELAREGIRETMRENMDTVRQIAMLLGENASRTESLLNSLLGDDE